MLSSPYIKKQLKTDIQSRKSLLAQLSEQWVVWWAAIFLVSVPVFFQAPLVRYHPWLSLIMTVGWLAIARQLLDRPHRQTWGSLMWGFSLTWLCGSIYWGWLRAQPLWHLPIEAIALPWAIWAICKQPQYKVGGWFYVGSLLGTAITDLYFYLTGLITYWQAIAQMETDTVAIQPVLQNAIAQMQTSWGTFWAILLGLVLMALGISAMRSTQIQRWAFSGAILSTLFVDGLFGIFCAFIGVG